MSTELLVGADGAWSRVRALLSASVLVNYVLGVAGQNAGNACLIAPETDRSAFLTAVAARWAELDPAEYPFMSQVAAAQLPEHDDREQFLADIDLILTGITTAE